MENQTSEANKCRLKIAQYSADLERFPVAIEIYENIAKSQVDNNLLKYSAKGNLLNAGLCRLNGDHSLLSTCMFHGSVCFDLCMLGRLNGEQSLLSNCVFHGLVCFDLCMLGITIKQIALREHHPIHELCH